MTNALWGDIESFVRDERGLSKGKVIAPSTTLEDGLGITGIEGEIFMEAFFARFKVDEGVFASGRHCSTSAAITTRGRANGADESNQERE